MRLLTIKAEIHFKKIIRIFESSAIDLSDDGKSLQVGLKMSQSSGFQSLEFEQIFNSRHQRLRAFEIGFTV